MTNVMAALPNIGGVLCSTSQSLADAQYWSAVKCIVCLSVCGRMPTLSHRCMNPEVTWRNGRGCPLVVHHLADLQSVHRLRCYGNITRTRNVSEYMLVLAVCLDQQIKTNTFEV